MPHYICTGGCKGVSDNPGTCQAQTCAKYGEPLMLCACEDGKHGSIAASTEKEVSNNAPQS